MMTTPENFRRRQRIEGVIVILLAILTTLQAIYFNGRDHDQQACFQQNFVKLSQALNARGALTERETAQNKALWSIYAEAAGLVKDDPTKPLTKKQRDRLSTELVAQLLEYKREINAIERERAQNPLPPYPVGTCEGK